VIFDAATGRWTVRERAGARGRIAALGLSAGSFLLAATEAVAAEGDLLAGDGDVKKRSLWLAFLMLGGIIIGGTLLLTLVVMWGNRTRRLARRPLPPVAQRDELWFLKPKPVVDDSTGEIDQAPTDAGSG